MIRPVLAARGQVSGVLAAVKAAAQVLILDEFTAANGTAISGRTPAPTNAPGNTWVVGGPATWTIQGNKATKTLGGAQNMAVINAADADVTVTCFVTVANAATRQGLAVRVVDIDNMWIVGWSNSNSIDIAERSGGTGTTRAATALSLTPGNTYEFRAVCQGATITVYVDGVQYVTYGSATAHQSATIYGLYAGQTTAPTWDNFKVLPQ